MTTAISVVLLILVTQAIYDFNTGPRKIKINVDPNHVRAVDMLHAVAAHGRRHQWMQFALAMVCLGALVVIQVLAC